MQPAIDHREEPGDAEAAQPAQHGATRDQGRVGTHQSEHGSVGRTAKCHHGVSRYEAALSGSGGTGEYRAGGGAARSAEPGRRIEFISDTNQWSSSTLE
ncbi:hypothetical protein GCM10007884_43460 [Methylobacterium brachythecii]|uniref:Uncharacterized protein n=1 Tax=Methylobacterium brachythecii TaxID=1176177 RepID=A0ABQ6DDV5_9HYPH|nr:hypothetical protein GCM10007884_43460 [Methylobacterium brachythecii]